MIIDLNGVEVEDRRYIKQPGQYILKVVEVIEDGRSKNGNQILKIKFVDKNGQIIYDEIVLTQNSLWRLKLVTDALQMPAVVDTQKMVGRYVIGHVELENYTNNAGQQKTKAVIKQYEKSKLTKPMEEMPDASQAVKFNEVPVVHDNNYPTPDITDDEILF